MIFKKVISKKNYNATIEIKLLKHSERIQVIKDLNFKVSVEGEIEKNANDSIEQFEKLTKILKERIISFHIISGNKEYYSFDDIEYFEEYSEITNILVGTLLSGVKMGEV